jgi:tripartite-type tricarboxylate transporter receptor subunit TctC
MPFKDQFIIRRRLLGAGLGAAAWLAGGGRALAQSRRQMSVVVPFTPGGATDIFARMYAEAMGSASERVLVENVPGANGAIGMARVASSPPDGRTLAYTYGNLALVAMHSTRESSFNILRDLTPVIRTVVTQGVIVTGPNSRFRTLPEFIAAAQKEPGKYTYADYGEIAINTLMLTAGIQLTRVPYKGGVPGMIDVMGGNVDIYAGSGAQVLPNILSGKLRALAVSSETKINDLPDVPLVRDFVPAFRALNYQGVFVSRNTPAAIVEEIYQQSLAAINKPDFQRQTTSRHATVSPMSPAEFKSFMETDSTTIAKVLAVTLK